MLFRCLVTVFVAAIASCAVAKPTGFKVVSGEARAPELDANGVLTVHSKNKAIIQWDQFSLGAAEAFRFAQPGKHAAVLNRVVGGDESKILGALYSNGNVYLINPNGVFIGPGGRIETAGFVASTLDVLDEDFINSRSLLFAGMGSGEIVNLGTILCETGNVALLGRKVTNEGSAKAPQGTVALGVGTEILLQPDATPYIYIRTGVSTSEEPSPEGAALAHKGAIEALAVELKAGSNVYAKAIQAQGLIDALTFENVGGEVYLIADEGICQVGGTIHATNGNGVGGTVQVLGDIVHMQETASIDVSGSTGGGVILAGGDFQGSNPLIKNAKRTWVERGAEFKANALESGNGGKVIFWGDESTFFDGNIGVQGGTAGGNGGLAEVSGAMLHYDGLCNSLAPMGQSGMLLLDPTDVTISTGVDSNNSFVTPNYTFSASPANINNITLGYNLDGGNVNISTWDNNGSADNGSVVFQNDVTWGDSTTLTVSSYQITVNSGVTISNTSAVVGFEAVHFGNLTSPNAQTPLVNSISISGTIQTAAGNVFLSAASGLNSAGNQYGVALQSGGAIAMGDSSILTMVGLGGGAYADESGGSNNYGVYIDSTSTLTLGSLRGFAKAYITGVGGSGGLSGGGNAGVLIAGSITTVGVTNALTFSDCLGGSGDSGANYGVWLNYSGAGSMTDLGCNVNFSNISGGSGGSLNNGVVFNTDFTISSGSLLFTDITGGTGIDNNYGVYIHGGQVSAQVVVAVGCFGGPGPSNSNIGFYISGNTSILGSTENSFLVDVSGGSLATMSNEVGIQIDGGGQIQASDGGTINLSGQGSGFYDGSGGNNYGIYFNDATLISGTGTTGLLQVINIEGIGGAGVFGQNNGVEIDTSLTVQLDSTNPENAINFNGCLGGSSGDLNCGVVVNAPLSVNAGTLNFQNIIGGGNLESARNHGLIVQSSVSAPAIFGRNIISGSGTGTNSSNGNIGLYINEPGVLGDLSITQSIDIEAASQGFGSYEYGIIINSGSVFVTGADSSINLVGMGGGVSDNASGTNNYGIQLINATFDQVGSDGSITLSGLGGQGLLGSHFGVNIPLDTALTISVDPSSTFNLNNCRGGSGQNGNYGVYYGAPGLYGSITTGGTFNISSVAGGDGGTSEHGVYLPTGAQLNPQTLTASNVSSGPGAGGDIGFYVNGGIVSTTGTLTISAISASLGTDGVGIQVDTVGSMSGDGVTLNGTGAQGDGILVELGGSVSSTDFLALSGVSSFVSNASAYYGVSLTGAGPSTVVAEAMGVGGITIIGTSGSTTLRASGGAGVNIADCAVTTISAPITIMGAQNAQILLGDCIINADSSTITISGPVWLTANTTSISGANGVLFTSTIDGPRDLIVDAGLASLTFDDNVGSLSPLLRFVTTAGSFFVGGNISTDGLGGTIAMANPVTLTGSSVMTTNDANIFLGLNSTVDGTTTNAQDLTFNPDSINSVTLGAVGSVVPLGDITILQGNNVTAISGIQALSFVQKAGTGRTTLGDYLIATTGSGGVNVTTLTVDLLGPTSITTSGANFSITASNNTSVSGVATIDTTLGTAGGNITFSGPITNPPSGTGNLSLTAGTGAGAGSVTFFSTLGVIGPYFGQTTVNSAQVVNLYNNITGTGFLVSAPVMLYGDVTIDTSNGTSPLEFDNTIDGGFSLMLNGNPSSFVILGDTIGGIVPLSLLGVTGSTTHIGNGVQSEVDITTATGGFLNQITFGPPVILEASSVMTTFLFACDVVDGQTSNANALTINATNVGLSGNIGSITPLGSFSIPNPSTSILLSGSPTFQTITAASVFLAPSFPLFGPLMITADTGELTLQGQITSSPAFALALHGDTTVTLGSGVGASGSPIGALTIPTGTQAILDGSFYVTSSLIQIPVLMTGPTTFDTTTAPGTTIEFDSTIDGPFLLTLNATDTVILNTVGSITPIGGLTVAGSGLNLMDDVTTDGAPVNFNIPVVVTSSVTVNTGLGGGGIFFNMTLDGPADLTLVAGTGNIEFIDPVGLTTPLNSLSVSNANAVTVASTLDVLSLSMLSTDIFINYGISSPNATVELNHSGVLALTGTCNTATFVESSFGGGTVSLLGSPSFSLNTGSGNNFTFFSPIAMHADSTFVSSSPFPSAFYNTIDGDSSFTAQNTHPSGALIFYGEVGSAIPPSDFLAQGGPIQVGANQTVNTTTGPMNYVLGQVQLIGSAIFTDTGTEGIQFTEGILANNGTTNFAVNVVSQNSNVSVLGAIDTTLLNLPGQSVQIEAGVAVNLSSSAIIASGGGSDLNAGFVTLTSHAGPVTVGGSIVASASGIGAGGTVMIQATEGATAGSGSIAITDVDVSCSGTGNGGTIYLQPDSGYTGGLPSGLINLTGTTLTTASTSGLSGLICLSPVGRLQPTVGVATITVGTIEVPTGLTIITGTMFMGPFECITSFGDVDITLTNYAVVGDIVVATGNPVSWHAPTSAFNPSNYMFKRPQITLLTSTGGTNLSPSTHVLAQTLNGNLVGNFTPAARVATVSIPPSELMFGSTVLNFDFPSAPPGPPPHPPFPYTRQELIYLSTIIATENENRLPMWAAWDWNYKYLWDEYLYYGIISSDPKAHETVIHFRDFIFEGRVK